MKLNYKSIAFGVILVAFVAGFLSAIAEDDVSALNDNPVFFLSIEAADISFMVGVNGVFAYAEYDHQGQVSLDLPVNHYMHPTESTVSLEASPPKKGSDFKPTARVKVDLRVRASGNFDTSYRLATLSFNSEKRFENNHGSKRFLSHEDYLESEQGDVEVSELKVVPSPEYQGSVKAVRSVRVKTPFPQWAFFGSDDLPNYYDFEAVSDEEYDKDLNDLLVAYNKVYEALDSGNIESVISMFSERNRETDFAFYRDPGETERTIRESLEESAKNGDLDLLDLKSDYVSLHPERNGKIVSLRREGMDPAVILNYKDGSGSVSYPLFFRKEDGKWILTR